MQFHINEILKWIILINWPKANMKYTYELSAELENTSLNGQSNIAVYAIRSIVANSFWYCNSFSTSFIDTQLEHWLNQIGEALFVLQH